MIRPAARALAFAVAVGVAGCGGGGDGDEARDAATTSTVPVETTTTRPPVTEELEQGLVDEQVKRTPDLTVGGAACPTGAPTAKGGSVECVVEVEGVAVPYKVTLVDITPEAGGSSGRYAFAPARPVVILSEVVATITAELEKQRIRNVTVDCGGAKIQVLDVGSTFECRISDGRRLRVEVKDAQGALSINQV